MHQLLRPHSAAAVQVQRHQRVGVAVVAQALAAVIVGAGRAGRHVDQAQRRIHRQRRPGIAAADRGRLLRLPAGGGGLDRIARHRIPPPQFAAAARVVATHHALLQRMPAVVADRAADHQHVAGHHRRRGHRIVGPGIAGVVVHIDAGMQVDRAVLAEPGAGLAVGGIQRDQPRIQSAVHDALAARARRRLCVAPETHPARGRVAVVLVARDLGIERPQFAAARRIQGEGDAGPGGEVHAPTQHQRIGLEAAPFRIGQARAEFAGAERPGDTQPADVVRGDLGQRRVLPAAGRAGITGPVAWRRRADAADTHRHARPAYRCPPSPDHASAPVAAEESGGSVEVVPGPVSAAGTATPGLGTNGGSTGTSGAPGDGANA
ncbi:hypothetical protein NB717_003039 [Xanthomonas sacchari]|nr:hypothetical protein [Xanthomonas sacchari]